MAGRRIRGLKRRTHRREPKRRFVLFCEGRNTEPAYFSAFAHIYPTTLLSIETIAGVGVPLTIAREATKRARELSIGRRRRPKNSYENRDEIWAVFDRDQHPNFDEAVDICRRGYVNVARSNPCFEVWLILHIEDYDKPDDRKRVQSEFQRLHPHYDPNGSKTPNCDELIKSIDDAIERADRQLIRRLNEGIQFGAPSTTVGEFIKAVRNVN